MRRAGIFLLSVSAASCAAPRAVPAPSSHPAAAQTPGPIRLASPGLEEGASLEAAVIVPATTEREGIAWENDWIYDRYGKFRKKSVALASREGRHYDVITVELADHTERIFYFDITDFLGK